MGSGNLALLDRAVQGAVALELGDGNHDQAALDELGIKPERTRTVGGLRVISNAARDAVIDGNAANMKDRLLRYRADRMLVTSKLESVGVTPIAVLPRTAWEQICNSAGLYRFLPRGDKVRVSGEPIIAEAHKLALADALADQNAGRRLGIMVWIGLMAVTVVLGLIFGWGFYVATALVAVFGGMILFGDETTPSANRKVEAEHIRRLTKEHEENGTLLAQLWPQHVEPEKGPDIGIGLPLPPHEVQERLIASEKARLTLHIAVVGEAIAFKQSPGDVLIGERGKYWDEIDRQIALTLDPIAYVVEGTAVAIIDQYGDFPIEQEVIHRVINSEHLV